MVDNTQAQAQAQAQVKAQVKEVIWQQLPQQFDAGTLERVAKRNGVALSASAARKVLRNELEGWNIRSSHHGLFLKTVARPIYELIWLRLANRDGRRNGGVADGVDNAAIAKAATNALKSAGYDVSQLEVELTQVDGSVVSIKPVVDKK